VLKAWSGFFSLLSYSKIREWRKNLKVLSKKELKLEDLKSSLPMYIGRERERERERKCSGENIKGRM
jgi:hypothetical protein